LAALVLADAGAEYSARPIGRARIGICEPDVPERVPLGEQQAVFDGFAGPRDDVRDPQRREALGSDVR
jgi:hypothetical protein